jgi:FG-GAP repeat
MHRALLCLVVPVLATGVAAQLPPADLHAWACGAEGADMVLEGMGDHAHLGYTAALGDFDGDGRDEILLGTFTEGLFGGGSATEDMVAGVFEYAAGTHPPCLADVGAEQQQPLLVVTGLMAPAPGGLTVAFVGDLDGDGREDFAVGAPWWEAPAPAQGDAGRVVVFLGGHWGQPPEPESPWDEDGPLTVDASQADFVLQNASLPRGRFGQSLAGADVNGDGYSDLLVGAPGCDDNHCNGDPGHAFVFLGGPCGLALAAEPCGSGVVVADAPTAADYALQGAHGFDRLGWALADAGDIDGDGRSEVAVSSLQATFEHAVLIARRIIETGPGEVRLWSPLDSRVSLLPAPTPPPGAHEGLFGFALARLEDISGDGVPELAVGSPAFAPAGQENRGAVTLFDGAAAWVPGGTAPPAALLPGATFLPHGAETMDEARIGWSVCDAGGDFDGDGRHDLLVGGWSYDEAEAWAPCYGYAAPPNAEASHAGRVLLLSTNKGTSQPWRVLARIAGEAGTPASGKPFDDNGRLGWGLAAGNLDGDGLPDLLTTAFGLSNPDPTPSPWSGGAFELGRAYVFSGLQLAGAVQAAALPAGGGQTPAATAPERPQR